MTGKTIDTIVAKERINVTQKEYLVGGFTYGGLSQLEYAKLGRVRQIECLSNLGPGYVLAQKVRLEQTAYTRYFGWTAEKQNLSKQRHANEPTRLRKIKSGQDNKLGAVCKRAGLTDNAVEGSLNFYKG